MVVKCGSSWVQALEQVCETSDLGSGFLSGWFDGCQTVSRSWISNGSVVVQASGKRALLAVNCLEHLTCLQLYAGVRRWPPLSQDPCHSCSLAPLTALEVILALAQRGTEAPLDRLLPAPILRPKLLGITQQACGGPTLSHDHERQSVPRVTHDARTFGSHVVLGVR